MSVLQNQISKRRTFAIIAHPDAGKTTLTEKLLLFGGAIQMAGTVKGRKAARHATSDWMEMEKKRGISVTTSVMQFPYKDAIINLLDTPGHEDFSEDTYRTLTAVDSALMVIDCAKGVESRTIKLMDVCRLRDTPIITFINKLDREGREPIDLLDEVENILKIKCAPITWPIGTGSQFKGVFHLEHDCIFLFNANKGQGESGELIEGLNNPKLDEILGPQAKDFRDEIDLVKGASYPFDIEQFKSGEMTPVFFGSAINNFGIRELLDAFDKFAPSPLARQTANRTVAVDEDKFSGFVFKIQANMDPAHRDRVAFLRVCSGVYKKNMKMKHVRIGRDIQISNAITFMANERDHADFAYPGDILGLHNHGTIKIGDTFTQGEDLKYTGIPNFAPELFRRIILKDPLKLKALQKGVDQLSEEGATQVFRPLKNNDIILGAVGVLQFDVVVERLKSEYKVECIFENVQVNCARWVECENDKKLNEFKIKSHEYLALDSGGELAYIATSRVNLDLTIERWPDIKFLSTREH